MEGLRVGQRHTLQLTDLAMGGEAIGRLDGFVVFVEDGAPGDESEVEITEVRKNHARGRIHKLLKRSPQRVEPPCPIFYECGGCQLQHLSYPAQLHAKSKMIEDVLRQAQLPHIPVAKCLKSQEFEYRNKTQLVAGYKLMLHSEGADKVPSRELAALPRGTTMTSKIHPGAKKSVHPSVPDKGPLQARAPKEAAYPQAPYLGLYARNSHRVVRMESCPISHPITNKILKAANTAIRQLQWSIYDEKENSGFLRHLITRVSTARNEALVVVVATSDAVPAAQQFVQMLRKGVPEIVGVLANTNEARTNVILGARTRLLWGRDHIIEEVNHLKFRVGATSFFQVNVTALRTLGEVVEEMLRPQPHETVLDAYCGVGALSLMLAPKLRKVIGIDEVAEAIENARYNASGNDIKNADFICGTVERILPQLYQRGERVSAIVLDPPRKGCEDAVLQHIAKMRVERVVYVSCNPPTMARDLAILAALDYHCTRIQPVDMFPQTAHVECVAHIVRQQPSGQGAKKRE